MTEVALYLFGQPRLEQNGTHVEVKSRKGLALLAYLAATGQGQSRDILATLLWPEQSQRRARGNLRSTLYSLGQEIELADWLDVDAERLALRPAAAERIDVARFARRLESGTIANMQQATALYTGDFLAGFYLPDSAAFEDWVREQQDAFRRSVLHALESLAADAMSRQAYRAAEAAVLKQLALDNLREETWRHLMTVLAADGRRTEALAAYERCRHALDAELDVPPAAETTALYEQIRRGQTEASHMPQHARHNLPAQTTRFVGREDELAACLRLLHEPDHRLITILGPGGIGKTRFALELAQTQVERFQDGVFFVELAQLATPEVAKNARAAHIVSAIAEAVQFQFHRDARSSKQQLLDYLQNKQCLLVLDNFEHLLVGVDLVHELLQTSPGLRLVVTSRERLQLGSETLFPLDGLEFPTWETPEDARSYSAVQLFLTAAQRVNPRSSFRPDEIQHVVRICRLVGGMPLGVILAATWVQVFSPAEIAAELVHGFDFLEVDLRDLPDRQRSMNNILAYSWNMLGETERMVMMGLSVFRGGFTLQAARQIVELSIPILTRLVNKSFIQRRGADRYDAHELLRQYAERELHTTGHAHAVKAKHAAYYLAFVQAQQEALAGHEQRRALAELNVDFENIRVAWLWAGHVRNYAAIDSALEGFFRWFWLARSRQTEGQALFQTAVDAWATVPDPAARCVWSRILVRIMEQQGPWLTDGATLQRQIAKAQETAPTPAGDAETAFRHWASALALVSQYRDVYAPDHLSRAIDLYRKSLAIYRQHGERFWQAQVLESLGHCYRQSEHYTEAEAVLQESLALRRATGDAYGAARSMRELGFVAYLQGRDRATEAAWQEAFDIQRQLGNPHGVADSRFFLCVLYLTRGDLPRAQEVTDEVAAIAADVNCQLYQQWTARVQELVRAMAEAVAELSHAVPPFPHQVSPFTARLFFLLFNATEHGYRNQLRRAFMAATSDEQKAICLLFAAKLFAQDNALETAVELVALACRHAGVVDGWIVRLPEIVGLRDELETRLGAQAFQNAWRRGQTIQVEAATKMATAFL